jgi:REP element-mobilizing transposase RayT
MEYNPDIHHRRSIRLKDFDYSQEGLYFITICVQDRECLFGKIIAGVENVGVENVGVENVGVENIQPLRYELILNDTGNMANECWLEIPKHFPNTILHEHIIMPNHVHGIIELKQHQPPLPHQRNEFQKMIPHSIGSIVKGFKIGVTKWFRNNRGGIIGAGNFQSQQPQSI